MIRDEIKDAEKYAKHAVSYKHQDPFMAEMFYHLANDELMHMEMIHEQVVRIIGDYKSHSEKPVPAGMMEMYDYIHHEEIENVKEVELLLDMYRQGGQ